MGYFKAMIGHVFAGAAAAMCAISAVAQTQKSQPVDDFSRLPVLIDAALGGKTGKLKPLGQFHLLPLPKSGVVEVTLTDAATGRLYSVRCPAQFEKGHMTQGGGSGMAAESYTPNSGEYVRFESSGMSMLVGTMNVNHVAAMPLSVIPEGVRSVYAEGKLPFPQANILGLTISTNGNVSTKQVAPKAEFKVQGDWNWMVQFGAVDAKYTTDAQQAPLMTPPQMLNVLKRLQAVCAQVM